MAVMSSTAFLSATTTQPQRALSLNGEIEAEPSSFASDVMVLDPLAVATQGAVVEFESVPLPTGGAFTSTHFRLRLMRKPWPNVNDKVGFESNGSRLVGCVKKIVITHADGHCGRWWVDISGTVDEFDGRGVLG